MHYTTISTALVGLVSVASCSPVASRYQAKRQDGPTIIRLTLTAKAAGQPFDGQVISANARAFKIGQPAAIACPFGPGSPFSCPTGNETIIQIGEGGSSMYSDSPGGQPISITNATGTLNFADPHLESTPYVNHDALSIFSFKADSANSIVGLFEFTGLEDKGWLACPDKTDAKNGTYVIRADVLDIQKNKADKLCTPLEIVGTFYTGNVQAFQYE